MSIDSGKTLNLEFWNWNPAKFKELQKRKTLNDRDIMALRYVAEELLSGRLAYEDFPTRDTIAKECSVCDEALYLGDFEGYKLNDTTIIRSLFINEDNRIIAEVLTDDEEYEHYLVY